MRFKELRHAILSFVLIILDFALIIHFLLIQNTIKLAIAIILLGIIVINYYKSFYVYVQFDGLLIYNNSLLFPMPVYIVFQDITDIIHKNNYCLIIKTKTKSYKMMIFNVNKRYELIKQKWEEYINA